MAKLRSRYGVRQRPDPAVSHPAMRSLGAIMLDEHDRRLLACSLQAYDRAWRELPFSKARCATEVRAAVTRMIARLRGADKFIPAAEQVDEQVDAAIAALGE